MNVDEIVSSCGIEIYTFVSSGIYLTDTPHLFVVEVSVHELAKQAEVLGEMKSKTVFVNRHCVLF